MDLSKRPPWRPSTAIPSNSRGPFGAVDEHTPLNLQQWLPGRYAQLGQKRELEMKTRAPRDIDSRKDIGVRDRMKMFADDAGETPRRTFKGPVKLKSSRRHARTPYDYDTRWISYPEKNTSLAPDPEEQWKTTFLETPRRDEDRKRKNSDWERRKNTIHHFDKKVGDYYLKVDQDVKIADARLLHNYQVQRANHMTALGIRRRIEKIRYFD
jgi:hypothetical protein